MIPKKIHYCWFGGKEKDDLSKRCIDSWKKYLSDYEFIEWNENNFDVEQNSFAKEAFEKKQYAFVADYARLYVLWKYGGIYLDCDVEVLKSFNEFLHLPAFTSYEEKSTPAEKWIEAGVLASEKEGEWITGALKIFDDRKFIKEDSSLDFTVLPLLLAKYTESIENISGIETDNTSTITIFGCEYFSPKQAKTNEIRLTKNSVCIHHFNNSWGAPYCKLRGEYIRKYGAFFGRVFFGIAHPIKTAKVIRFKTQRK